MSEEKKMMTGYAPVPTPAVLDTMVKIIMSQTEMTHEEVISALEHKNYDLKKVIRDYMTEGNECNQKSANVTTATSTNQLRFSEIRNFMDKSAELYYRRQEMTKIYNQVLERKKAEAKADTKADAKAEADATSVATTVSEEVSKL